MAIRSEAEEQLLKEATASLERVQNFDVRSLVREEELGKLMAFKEVVDPAQRVVDLYKRMSLRALEDLPENILQSNVRDHANATWNLFSSVAAFKPDQGQGAKDNLVNQIINNYAQVFGALHPFISYSLQKSADFQRLDAEARGALGRIQKASSDLEGSLEGKLGEATRIVEEVRKVAAETGVSQQAIYFKDEAVLHLSEAEVWRKRTIFLAWMLGVWAVITLFLAEIPIFHPVDGFQNFQLAISKALVFTVISFMLYLAAKNFMAHRHNAIVNRHRQNALLTYRAFVEASGEPELAKVILSHAAACVFSPQPTGYSQDSGVDAAKATSVVEVLGKQITGGKT